MECNCSEHLLKFEPLFKIHNEKRFHMQSFMIRQKILTNFLLRLSKFWPLWIRIQRKKSFTYIWNRHTSQSIADINCRRTNNVNWHRVGWNQMATRSQTVWNKHVHLLQPRQHQGCVERQLKVHRADNNIHQILHFMAEMKTVD